MKTIITLLVILSLNLHADTASWISPNQDYVGLASATEANGINDWHVRINSPQLALDNSTVWRINGGLWYSMGERGRWVYPYSKGFSKWNANLKVIQMGSQVDIYFEPLLAWPGMIFEVEALQPGKSSMSWQVLCSAQEWHAGGTWLGQGAVDLLSPNSTEGDRVREWELLIKDDFLNSQPARIDVWLPYREIGSRLHRGKAFTSWSSVKNEKCQPLNFAMGSGEMTVSINPVLATGGDEFFVRAVLQDGSWALWKIIGMGSDWQRDGVWYGQADYDYVSANLFLPNGVKDWRLNVSSDKLISPVRWTIRGANSIWESESDYKKSNTKAAYVNCTGNSADIYLDPVSERAGDTFFVSAILADGSVISWGVTSVHQIRSSEVKWLGQDYTEFAYDTLGQTTNRVMKWKIEVSDDKFEKLIPVKWTVKNKNDLWEFPLLAEQSSSENKSLTIKYNGRKAEVFLAPKFAIAGDQYEIEALFADGTLIQWTAVADGKEWVSAAEWVLDSGIDYVGLKSPVVADGQQDWQITLNGQLFAQEQIAQINISGSGRHWLWPDAKNIAPLSHQLSQDTLKLFFAPISLQKSTSEILTIRIIFASGEVRYWLALQPTP